MGLKAVRRSHNELLAVGVEEVVAPHLYQLGQEGVVAFAHVRRGELVAKVGPTVRVEGGAE